MRSGNRDISDAEEFVRTQHARDENPVETIKEVRRRYGMELGLARELVVTPVEIAKFLAAQRAIDLSRLDARMALKRRFACGGKEALAFIDASGLWTAQDKKA